MKTKIYLILCFLSLLIIASCKKDSANREIENDKVISPDILQAIKLKGFSTNNVIKFQNGYIVEGDIFLDIKALKETSVVNHDIVIAKTEQYKTYNLVRSLPRVISVSVQSGLSSNFVDGVDIAVSRYNALGLNLTFQRVSSGGEIQVSVESLPPNVIGASPAFPNNDGNPGGIIKLASAYFNGSTPATHIGSVLQHEIGHAIGLRHTDWFNRDYSCPYDPDFNVESTNNGVVHIPGTPTTEDSGSFMLSCGDVSDFTFNSNDIIALNYIYGGTARVPRTIKSNAFSNVFLRLDGRGITSFISSGGGGTVNSSYGAVSFETFYFNPQIDGTYTIESYAFPNVFLRADHSFSGSGAGGTVNAQYTAGAYEKFIIYPQIDGTYIIRMSTISPLGYLRLDGRGVDSSNPIGGVVNLSGSAGAWEKFIISPAL